MTVYLGNAFSLQMVNMEAYSLHVEEVAPADVPQEAVSCIGHSDTAHVVSHLLGREVPCQRISVSLHQGDVLYVAQLVGGRLPEGSVTLPEGFSLVFRKVTFE